MIASTRWTTICLLPTVMAILAANICGCSTTPAKKPPAASGLDSHVERRANGTTWIEVTEDGRAVLEMQLSDSNICETSLSEEAPIKNGRFDFDGDGSPEIVLSIWEGGNGYDTVFVFGKRNGSWSKWGDFLSPFQYELRDVDNDGRMDFVLPAKHGNESHTIYYRDGRFVP